MASFDMERINQSIKNVFLEMVAGIIWTGDNLRSVLQILSNGEENR